MYNPSGISPFFKYKTFSLAFSKSSFVTFILLSRKAISPASVHIALISAPDKSSFVEINSFNLTFVSNICYIFVQVHFWCVNCEYFVLCFQVWHREFNFSIYSTGSDESRIKRFYFVGGHDNLDLSMRVEPV